MNKMGDNDKQAYIIVVLCQLIYGANYILGKDALNGGMPTTVFAFYRLFVGTLVFLPIAFFLGRKNAPKMSWKIGAKIFFLAMFGATFMLNIFAVGVKYTPSTVTSAISNAIPVVTFALAVLLRLENVAVKKLSGIAKVVGVALCLAGVLMLAFYEGPNLKSVNHHRPILHASDHHEQPHSKAQWILGTFIMIFFAIAWSCWIILQGPILKEYPSKILFSAICTFFGAVQSFFVALVAERDFDKWKLRLDDSLIAVLYTGAIVSGLAFYLQLWCIEKKGPVFFAIWQPLSFLITLAASSFFLGEIIKLGSVLGGLLMVVGLYSVLWGKQRDNLRTKQSTKELEINCNSVLPVSKDCTATTQEHSIVVVGDLKK